MHAVPSLLSQLLSGRTDEQVMAARKLHAYCRACGRPVEAAIAAAGGVHMLLIMLDSLERTLRDICIRILTDMAADHRIRCAVVRRWDALQRLACAGGRQRKGSSAPAPPNDPYTPGSPAAPRPTPPVCLCSAEILSAPGGTAKVIQLMYRGILDGQASAGRFLELLATSRSEAVQVGDWSTHRRGIGKPLARMRVATATSPSHSMTRPILRTAGRAVPQQGCAHAVQDAGERAHAARPRRRALPRCWCAPGCGGAAWQARGWRRAAPLHLAPAPCAARPARACPCLPVGLLPTGLCQPAEAGVERRRGVPAGRAARTGRAAAAAGRRAAPAVRGGGAAGRRRRRAGGRGCRRGAGPLCGRPRPAAGTAG